MPETCENWLGLVYSRICYAFKARETYELLPYSVEFMAAWELWMPRSMTVLAKYRFMWNEGPANILIDRNVYVDLQIVFLYSWHCIQHYKMDGFIINCINCASYYHDIFGFTFNIIPYYS